MTLGNGQLEYDGYVLGDDIDTFMTELTGWDDLPPVDSGNSNRSMYMGSYPGRKIPRERVITWVGVFNPENLDDWLAKLRALRAAFTVSDTEIPLTIRTLDEELVCNAAVVARAIPNNRRFGAAKLADVSIQFVCSDPRRYAATETIVSIGFPSVTGDGLDYPLVYPLDYGTAIISGTGMFHNDGDSSLPAVYRVYGPCENPTIWNDTTGYFVTVNLTLIYGEYFDISTQNSSIILNGNTDRLYSRSSSSSPIIMMELVSGDNQIRVSASSWTDAAYVTVTAASAAYI